MVRVLVVDDEKEIRGGLVTQLPWAEWGVDEVLDSDDGDTALELARRYRPDLIITDIRMPRMSGLQLLEELVKDRFEGESSSSADTMIFIMRRKRSNWASRIICLSRSAKMSSRRR
ncbi:response regulator [Paenibacillus sp. CC-CFT747]|nr:response regulator [Paenibacillus sp. CC-CFT747]